MSPEPIAPRTLLERHGLRAKHSFGQNFLTDPRICEKIAALCTTPPGGTVVEIGAGLGALTVPLLERAGRVLAVERDRDLVPLLREALEGPIAEGRLEIIEADAKRVDYAALLGEGAARGEKERLPRPHVLAGNLPYQLTGPLLELTVAHATLVDRAVYMVQLEVAERLVAAPATKEYGALTVFVEAAFSVERAFIVRRGAFQPQPNVDSAVVVLTPRSPRITDETEGFRAVVKAAFAQRRKTLRNAWRGLAGLDAERVSRAAHAAGIDLDARGETLDAHAFAAMAREVSRLE